MFWNCRVSALAFINSGSPLACLLIYCDLSKLSRMTCLSIRCYLLRHWSHGRPRFRICLLASNSHPKQWNTIPPARSLVGRSNWSSMPSTVGSSSKSQLHNNGRAWCPLCPRHHTLNLPRKQRPKQGKTQENPQLGLVVHGHPHIAKSQHKGKNKIQTENCKTLVFIKWIKIDVEINERVQTTYVFSPRIIWLLYPSA